MHGQPTASVLARTGGAAALGLMLPTLALAAPWRDHVTLPSGDVVQVRTQGRALKPSGSRLEVDLPVRVRFATAVASPVGPVAAADATVRVICQGGSVSAKRLVPRDAAARTFASKDRTAAVQALRAPLEAALNEPAFLRAICGT